VSAHLRVIPLQCVKPTSLALFARGTKYDHSVAPCAHGGASAAATVAASQRRAHRQVHQQRERTEEEHQ
jgi:hypothetical protein